MQPLITIGLEIHLKLATQSKIFCPCKNDQSLENNPPNTNICPVCTGQPGALPQLSLEVVEKALLLGKALNCRINNPSFFDRKSYFYPDLPMGYQITQLYSPINGAGQLSFFLDNYDREKTISITDAHLECDTAKSIHQGDEMLLDFNRAGTPLIEIVTGPDFTSAEEAVAFAKEIQRIAKYNALSDADMEKGQMRVDVNISIRKQVTDPLGTRVELKNINSFAAIKRAVDAEVERQKALLASGNLVEQETRRRDDLSGVSQLMRSKEDALDYRYFPEPDLPPLFIDAEYLEQLKTTKLDIPYVMIKRMVSDFGFHKEYINALLADKKTLDFFFLMVDEQKLDPKGVAKWIVGAVNAYMLSHFLTIDQLPFSLVQFQDFLHIAQEGKIIDNQLKVIMEAMLETGKNADELIKLKGFDAPGIDDQALEAMIQDILQEHPEIVEQYHGGKTTTLGFFIGQLMKKTAGKVDPKKANQLVMKALSK